MRLADAGQAFFALTMIAVGVMSLVSGHFGPIWSAMPKDVPARDVLVYVTAFILISASSSTMRTTPLFISLPVLVRAVTRGFHPDNAGDAKLTHD